MRTNYFLVIFGGFISLKIFKIMTGTLFNTKKLPSARGKF